MRHRKSGRKLGVTTKHRKAMFRNMATDLLRNGRINTTDTRAKEIRRVVEKLVTLGKNGSLHARRKALGYIRDRAVVEKLFSELAERYMERPGGYTRIVKLGYRRGDNAPISLIELVTEEYKPRTKRRKAGPGTGSAQNESSKKKSAEELGLIEQEDATGGQVDEQGETGATEARSSEQESGPAEQEDAAGGQVDEQGETGATEARSSEQESGPAEQEDAAGSQVDEQGETEATEARSSEEESAEKPDPGEAETSQAEPTEPREQGGSSEKAGD